MDPVEFARVDQVADQAVDDPLNLNLARHARLLPKDVANKRQ